MNFKRLPSFTEEYFLKKHINTIFDFYHPRCIDSKGGFFHIYLSDGKISKPHSRHLVNSARFVINYARMATINKDSSLLQHCTHGLDFIEAIHGSADSDQYYWELDNNQPVVKNDYCYGWVFVLLAYAEAINCGLTSYKESLYSTYERMNQKFWQAQHQLYADEFGPDKKLTSYRGQNANMHAVEALLSCYQATNDGQFLERAYVIASRITNDLADVNSQLIWEHFTSDWEIDWQYNIDKPDDMFRPWGFQTGHQTEWAKLLLILFQRKPEAWMVEKAEYLFNQAMELGWDSTYGGLVYGFDPSGDACDTDKHFWVHAESFAAASYLYKVTKNTRYLDDYQRIWEYAWNSLVDHEHGAWHHKLTREGHLMSNIKSPLGKNDYHTLGACYDVLNAFSDLMKPNNINR